MNPKLDKYEQEIEDNVSQYKPVSAKEKSRVEAIIDKANEKKSISLRLKTNDLEQLKRKADIEGLPYQTLLSSIVHKFVTDQLVDKRSILKSMEILKAS
ncbi:MAG: antitoxin [Deltaproteobacteria bacterium]|nr:antitoxin [Candidatus Tharpella sp.]